MPWRYRFASVAEAYRSLQAHVTERIAFLLIPRTSHGKENQSAHESWEGPLHMQHRPRKNQRWRSSTQSASLRSSNPSLGNRDAFLQRIVPYQWFVREPDGWARYQSSNRHAQDSESR